MTTSSYRLRMAESATSCFNNEAVPMQDKVLLNSHEALYLAGVSNRIQEKPDRINSLKDCQPQALPGEYHRTAESQKDNYAEPKTLSWINISAKTTITEGKRGFLSCCGSNQEKVTKTILNNVSGIAKARTFLAVIGSSGSGKTTLLNCLTQRNLRSLTVQGRILVNGNTIGEEIAAISGYVQQEDIFLGSLTVKEHLWFNASLRLDNTLPDHIRQERVEQVIEEMSLKKCEHTIIGVPGLVKALSGGERKRLAFAAELLTKPALLVCDEPTTGLDSFTTRSVIQALKDLTNKGHTVLATLHQPSSDIFSMFDEILIMAEGRVVFMGSKNDATTFFSGMGYHCHQACNAADFFIDTLAIIPEREKESKDRIQKICNYFDESSYADAIKYQIRQQENIAMENDTEEKERKRQQLSDKRKYQAMWGVQFRLCFWRSMLEVSRSKAAVFGNIARILVLGVFISLVYLRQNYTSTGAANINAILFTMMLQIALNVSFASSMRFSNLFILLVKEHYDRQYSISAFYLAGILFEYLSTVILVFVYLPCPYWVIGLYPDAETYFTCTATIILLTFLMIGQGNLCGSLFTNTQITFLFRSFIVTIQLLFSGFLLKEGFTPKLFKILELTSGFRYAYQALFVSQWRNVQYIECDSNDGNSTTATIHSKEDRTICYHNGAELIESYGYELDSIGYCLAVMVLLLFVTEIISYIALLFKVKRAK